MAVTHFKGPIALGSASTEVISAAKTLTKDDNGKVFFLNNATGVTVTLPAVTNIGWRAKFIVGAVFATTNFIVASAEGDNMEGSFLVAGVVVVGDAEDQINFVASAEDIGDWAEVISDGTSWLMFGNAAATGGITVTDPA